MPLLSDQNKEDFTGLADCAGLTAVSFLPV